MKKLILSLLLLFVVGAVFAQHECEQDEDCDDLESFFCLGPDDIVEGNFTCSQGSCVEGEPTQIHDCTTQDYSVCEFRDDTWVYVEYQHGCFMNSGNAECPYDEILDWCDDDDPCTVDSCDGGCYYDPIPECGGEPMEEIPELGDGLLIAVVVIVGVAGFGIMRARQ